MNKKIDKIIKKFQRNEITENIIYNKIADILKEQDKNRKILKNIAEDEKNHYNIFKRYTNKDIKPNRLKIWWYYVSAVVLGITFSIKIMERGEESAQENYRKILKEVPESENILKEENEHENELIKLLDEERLKYVGSMVLGLNDALVELTGVLAGLTFAFQNTRLIAMAGLITGIAASFSMAASEYLSTKSEESEQSPVKASFYTGIAYIGTVFLLVMPFLLFTNIFLCLGLTLGMAVVIIFFFNYYISIAKDLNFKKRFFEMAGISLSVAILSFIIGFLVRNFLGVEI
ncbi:MAG: VIT1/CCC1 transporter family protein [Elusimicrobiota bacterium]